jgi:hypothetical protein
MNTYQMSYVMVRQDGIRLSFRNEITASNTEEAMAVMERLARQDEKHFNVAVINIRFV